MKAKKLIKAIAGVCLSAVLVAGISIPAAAGYAPANSASDALGALGADYGENYFKLLEKYDGKDLEKEISYGKSETKKLMSGMSLAVADEYDDYAVMVMEGDRVAGMAKYGAKAKYVASNGVESKAIYACGGQLVSVGLGEAYDIEIFSDPIEIEACKNAAKSIENKVKELMGRISSINISDNTAGFRAKFKSGGKVYYFEKFDDGENRIAVLYDEYKSPLALKSNNNICALNFTTDVSDNNISLSAESPFIKISIF